MNIEKIKEILVDGTIGYFATANGEQLEVRKEVLPVEVSQIDAGSRVGIDSLNQL